MFPGKRVRFVITALLLLAVILTSCGTPAAPATPQVVTKVETKIVEKVVTSIVEKQTTQECPTPAPTQPAIPSGYHLVKDGELGKLDNKSRIAVISAFDAELALLLKNTQVENEYLVDGVNFTTGRLMNNDVVLFESGVSMINATKNTDTAPFLFNINHQAMSGIAGGVNPALNIGDVSVPARWAAYQEAYYAPKAKDGTYSMPAWAGTPPFPNFNMFYPQLTTIRTAQHPEGETSFWWPVDQEMLEVARSVAGNVKLEKCASQNCLDNQPKVVVGGNGVSGQTFVDNAEYRDWVFRNLDPQNGVNVLDMESAATVITARTKGNGIPTIVFRSLSDLAGGGPGANEIGTFFQLAADNSAKVMMAFLEAWANRASLQPVKPTRAVLDLIGDVGDHGWSYIQERAIREAEKILGKSVQITVVSNVPDNESAEDTFRSQAMEGYDVIIANSFNHMGALANVAKDFPQIRFLHCTGFTVLDNMAIYDIRGYQGWYLAGIIAGRMSKTNHIGYVFPVPIPEVRRNFNAFVLGARSVNPNIIAHFVVTGVWLDVDAETTAATTLIAAGCDVVARESDTTATEQVCEKAGVWSIGYNSGTVDIGRKTKLCDVEMHWGKYFTTALSAIRNGYWQTGAYWGDISEGAVTVEAIGPMVPQETKDLVMAKRRAMMNGEFQVFTGPIKDNTGLLVVPAGRSMTDGEMLGINFLVEGILGQNP